MAPRQEEHRLPCLEWRQATAADEPFILDLTYRTMQEYLAAYGLRTEADMKPWLKARNGKFHWFVGAREGIPMGGLAFSRLADRINIDSIHILPEWQNQGLGTEAIRKMLQWAARQRLPVVLQVMKHNSAAKRLYERLGFTVFSEDERIYHLWQRFIPAEV